MPRDFVFAGPTLPAEEIHRLLPGATVLPPIRHGDLLRAAPRAGDRVLIIDGLFMLIAPVRHKEILDALARGVTVAGSSSMGALRAAELWRYGMRGVGTVFTLYRDGVVTADDEVTIVHGPADEGHRPLSEPLINLRVSLDRAVAAGTLTPDEAHALLECGRAVPFRARGPRMLRRRAHAAGLAAPHDRYAAWAATHPVDAKAEDALALLRTAADGLLRPHGDGDAPIESVGTVFFEAWRTRHHGDPAGPPGTPWAVGPPDPAGALRASGTPEPLGAAGAARTPGAPELLGAGGAPGTSEGPAPADGPAPVAAGAPGAVAGAGGRRWVSDAKVIAALMLLHPDFPALHRRHVLRMLTGAADDVPEREVARRALAAGLSVVDADGARRSGWLTGPERAALSPDEATIRVLVRAFGTQNSKVLPYRALPPELRDPDVLERTRALVASAERLAERLPHPDPHRPHRRLRYRTDVVDRTLAGRWGCPVGDLTVRGWDRGFGDLDWLRITAEPFVSWLKAGAVTDRHIHSVLR